MSLKKKNSPRIYVIGSVAGGTGSGTLVGLFDEATELAKCLTFARTRQIAERLSAGRENELRHIRSCRSCGARLRAFQRELGTAPNDTIHHRLQQLLHGVTHRAEAAMVEHYGHHLFSDFKAGSDESAHDHGHRWHRTHDLAHALHQAARQAARHQLPIYLRVWQTALVHAAETHAVEAQSIDDVALLVQCLEEGVTAATTTSSLVDSYAALYSAIMIDSPPVVRHALIVSLWNLAGHGPKTRHLVANILRILRASRHAGETAAAVALIHHFHNLEPTRHEASHELPPLLERVAVLTENFNRIFAEPPTKAVHEHYETLLAWTFTHHSPRAQVIDLIVTEVALRASAHGDDHRLRELISHHLEPRSPLAAPRPRFIDLELAAALGAQFPHAFTDAALDRLHADADAHEPNPFERHQVVVRAIEIHEKHLAHSHTAPHFTHSRDRWRFDAIDPHPLDRFWQGLTTLANENPQHALHVEWAKARFEEWAHEPAKKTRARTRAHRTVQQHLEP